MRDNSLTSTLPNLEKSTLGHGNKSRPPPKEAAAGLPAPLCITDLTKALTSSPMIRPFRPVPLT